MVLTAKRKSVLSIYTYVKHIKRYIYPFVSRYICILFLSLFLIRRSLSVCDMLLLSQFLSWRCMHNRFYLFHCRTIIIFRLAYQYFCTNCSKNWLWDIPDIFINTHTFDGRIFSINRSLIIIRLKVTLVLHFSI